jgi:hypothetical protein
VAWDKAWVVQGLVVCSCNNSRRPRRAFQVEALGREAEEARSAAAAAAAALAEAEDGLERITAEPGGAKALRER